LKGADHPAAMMLPDAPVTARGIQSLGTGGIKGQFRVLALGDKTCCLRRSNISDTSQPPVALWAAGGFSGVTDGGARGVPEGEGQDCCDAPAALVLGRRLVAG
jgi:hypothetical protein